MPEWRTLTQQKCIIVCVCLCVNRTKLCDETAITDRYPWTLEIIPSNPAMRVYYVAAGAKKELEVCMPFMGIMGVARLHAIQG